jgi:PHO85 cyclin-6/7
MRPDNNIPRLQSSSSSGSSSNSQRPSSGNGLRRSHISSRSSTIESPTPAPVTRPNNPASPLLPPSSRASQTISSAPSQTSTPPASPPKLDIANYPPSDLLKLLATLLQQIASANDKLRGPTRVLAPTSVRSTPPSVPESADIPRDATVPRTVVGVLPSPSSFHARNIPTISIESYLLRILKYCPTTNEVFLSLLVYFDRMSAESGSMAPGFAIDSYNVHRLIIAGVTVASKFFSDVFYLNSRYAKVSFFTVYLVWWY